MPESRGRRPRKPIQQGISHTATNKPTKVTKELSNPTPEPKRFRPLETWKNIWAVMGPAIALIGPTFLLWPDITIEASPQLDPSDPLTTQFRVTNIGRVPIYNIRFSCKVGIGGGSAYFGDVRLGSGSLAPIESLRPGDSATRSCVISSSRSDVPNLEIGAIYKWPIIPKEDIKVGFFRVVRTTTGAAVLLPDISPLRH